MLKFALAALLLLALPGPAPAQMPPENQGPNPNIVRWARGTYAYRGLSDGRDRGWERFQLFAHQDGSRTMIMWHDLRARSGQFNVVLHVDAGFRPITAFVDYWTANGHKGSALFTVADDALEQRIVGGPFAGTVENLALGAGGFSLGTHPVSADAWHRPAVAGDAAAAEGRIVSLEASSDLAKPMLGDLQTLPITAPVAATITVPAGTFDVETYRLGDFTVWAMGPDQILVRMTHDTFGLEYVLTEFDSGE